jgi:hypothetical protein
MKLHILPSNINFQEDKNMNLKGSSSKESWTTGTEDRIDISRNVFHDESKIQHSVLLTVC